MSNLRAKDLAADPTATRPTKRFAVPTHAAMNPGTGRATTPGSFANQADIGGPLAFSSPDSPGMPEPSPYTAWDFLPEDWSAEVLKSAGQTPCASSPCSHEAHIFTDARGLTRRVTTPPGFTPITQL